MNHACTSRVVNDSVGFRLAFVTLSTALLLSVAPALADVTGPADVAGLRVDRSGGDVILSWGAVTTDALGNPETVDHYNVYRGETKDFVPDKAGGLNKIGESTTTSFTDVGAASGPPDAYYLVSAVDTSSNEGGTKTPTVSVPAVLSATWTDSTIDLSWTDAEPADQVSSYRVYYGNTPDAYEFVDDVGLVNNYSKSGLAADVMWYFAVTAVDLNGNEGGFSNEVAEVVGGVITIVAHDEGELCWGASKCTPSDPEHIQRNDGFQLLVPAEFPPGDWTSVELTFIMDSRLCDAPVAPDKCGDQNPGWNPCGDPWDRTAHLFLVLDDCIAAGGSCITNDNLELMRAITPFGTDALPPDGSGVVPPRELTLDITPYAPLLNGRMYVGAHIGHFVPKGWWVTSSFRFSKRPEEVSPKPPADGIEVLFFGGAEPPAEALSIPASATQVYTRLFTTGHGGNARCDGGSNDGGVCSSSAECPGGTCQNCDEFCHRTNQILVDGAPAWEAVPWRDDCSPGSVFACSDWNACGWPSCVYSRAGWCPGYVACHHDAPCDQDLDMTSSLAPGGTYDVDYNVLVRTGSWSVSLVAYWYE